MNISIIHIYPQTGTIERLKNLIDKINFSHSDIAEKLDEEYCKKINSKADIFMAVEDNTDIGMAAVYMNQKEKTAYVTFLGIVRTYQGSAGLTRLLTESFEQYAKKQKIEKITAEFHVTNRAMVYYCKRYNYKYSTENSIVNSYQQIEKIL